MAYLETAFIPALRRAEIIKIHQNFPDLWSQMYCHVFYETLCTRYSLHSKSVNI